MTFSPRKMDDKRPLAKGEKRRGSPAFAQSFWLISNLWQLNQPEIALTEPR